MDQHRIRLLVSSALVVALTACTGSTDPGIEGTFTGTGVTPLPSPPLPAGDLEIAAELRLDGEAGTFALDMDLSSMGLMDVVDLRGTYVAGDGSLTLLPTGFEIDPASGNVAEGLCISLAGFAETQACFAEMQEGEYEDASIALSLAHEIAGVGGTTTLMLPRSP